MWLIDQLAEQKIRAAIERGELDNLPGAGKPLELDDDRLIPEELRAGYRLLKNAGYLPAELQIHREIAEAEELLRLVSDPDERSRTALRLSLLRARLGGGRADSLVADAAYRERIEETLEGPEPRKK